MDFPKADVHMSGAVVGYTNYNDPEETINQIGNPAFYQDISELRSRMEEWFGLYTEPERDGSRQNVKGKGQVGLIDDNKEAFAQDVQYLRDS